MSSRPPSPWWMVLLRPWIWGVLCAVVAVPLYLAGRGGDFSPFLLTIGAGALFAMSFVNAVISLRPTWLGWVLHVSAAALLAGGMAVVTRTDGFADVSRLPEAAAAVALFGLLAAGPFAGWVWIGLLARLTALVPEKKVAAATAEPPRWAVRRKTWSADVSAVPLRMRTLVVVIAVMVLVVGGLGAWLLITLDDVAYVVGPRISLLLLGAVFGLPAYFLLRRLLRRRRHAYTVGFDDDSFDVAGPDGTRIHLYADIAELQWQPTGEYARVVVRTRDAELSLFTSLTGEPSGLPPIPENLTRILVEAGLSESRSRRGVRTFAR